MCRELGVAVPNASSAPIELGVGGPVAFLHGRDDLEVAAVRRADCAEWIGEVEPEIEELLRSKNPLVRLVAHVDGNAIYLAEARWTSFGRRRRGGPLEIRFCVQPHLSRDVLERVRPLRAPVPWPSQAWLDALIAGPPTTATRLAALSGFLKSWYSPSSDDGIDDLSLARSAARHKVRRWPIALATLWRHVGRRPEALASQNLILNPADDSLPMFESGRLPVYTENQGVFLSSVDLEDEDPTVVTTRLQESPVTERERLSGFLLQACIYEAMCGANYSASCSSLTKADYHEILSTLRAVPLGGWHWPADPGCFWVGQGILAFTNPEDAGLGIVMGAMDRRALAYLRDFGAEAWDIWDG